MKFISAIILFALAGVAHAGGDFVLGKVSAFAGKDGNYRFHFSQAATRPLLMEDCAEFDVTVKYEHIPWFSWLIPSSHPSKKETNAAAVMLHAGQLESREVYFGYMGYGLVPTDAKCTFKSRGLKVQELEGKQLVISYHDLT